MNLEGFDLPTRNFKRSDETIRLNAAIEINRRGGGGGGKRLHIDGVFDQLFGENLAMLKQALSCAAIELDYDIQST